MSFMKNFLLCLFLSVAALIGALEKRDAVRPMTVSVIIPCHSNHFELLRDLLHRYRLQSVAPEEIVISLSNAGQIDAGQIQRLEKQSWPFKLKIIRHQEQLETALNRNAAASASTGDLIICQDADDLPHRQRIQILKYLFENYQIDFLIHKFVFDENEFPRCNLRDVPAACHRFRGIDENHLRYQQQGAPALTRDIFKQVQWEKRRDGFFEDELFSMKIQPLCENFYILCIPLMVYRSNLSAWDH